MNNLGKIFATSCAVGALALSAFVVTDIGQTVEAYTPESQFIEINPFTTAGQRGHTNTTTILQTNANRWNPGNTWEVPNGTLVVHQGRRVWDNTGWGFWERVRVSVSGTVRYGYIFSDDIRW